MGGKKSPFISLVLFLKIFILLHLFILFILSHLFKIFNLNFLLKYNVMPISAIQQSESVTHINILFHNG